MNRSYLHPGAEVAFLALCCALASALNYWFVKGLIWSAGVFWSALCEWFS